MIDDRPTSQAIEEAHKHIESACLILSEALSNVVLSEYGQELAYYINMALELKQRLDSFVINIQKLEDDAAG